MSTTVTMFVTADALDGENDYLPEIFLWDAEPTQLAEDDAEETTRRGDKGAWYAAGPDEGGNTGMAEYAMLLSILKARGLTPAPGEKCRITITVEKPCPGAPNTE